MRKWFCKLGWHTFRPYPARRINSRKFAYRRTCVDCDLIQRYVKVDDWRTDDGGDTASYISYSVSGVRVGR